MPLSALKFHFSQITFSFPVITRTHTPTKTESVFPKCLKNALHTFFLKIPFFCSLHLLLTPETLPNHLFRQTNDQKCSKTYLKGGKNLFLSFYKLLHIFPLPLPKKTKPLTFFPLFITGNRKSASENVFLFFFLTFFHPTAPRNRKNYHLPFFSKFRLKVP